MTNDTLVVITRVVFLTLFAVAVGTLWVVLVTRNIRLVPYAWISVAVATVAVGPFSLAAAAQADRRHAATVRGLEDRYDIEIDDPQFTQSLAEWTIDGKTRRCAYVAADADGRPALLCADITLTDHPADHKAADASSDS